MRWPVRWLYLRACLLLACAGSGDGLPHSTCDKALASVAALGYGCFTEEEGRVYEDLVCTCAPLKDAQCFLYACEWR